MHGLLFELEGKLGTIHAVFFHDECVPMVETTSSALEAAMRAFDAVYPHAKIGGLEIQGEMACRPARYEGGHLHVD